MDQIIVADSGMDEDRAPEAADARQRQCLPKIARRCSFPDATANHQTADANTAAEARAVVSDEGDEAGIDGLQLRYRHIHELQVLRNENTGHSDNHNGRASGYHARAGQKKASTPQSCL